MRKVIKREDWEPFVNINGETLKQVKNVTFYRHVLDDGKYEISINKPTGLTRYIFNRLEQILMWKNTAQKQNEAESC